MNKPNIGKMIGKVGKFMDKHKPEILTGIGVAGMITSIVLAVEATPKALQLIDEERERREEESDDELVEPITKLDVVKTTWRCYIPTVVTCIASATCLIGSTAVSTRRTAAMAAAYKLSEEALTLYKEKVVETIGEKKEKTVREKVQKEHIERNPASTSEVIIAAPGDVLFFDVMSSRYFESDLETIKRAVNDLNKRMLNENYVSLSQFYDELNLKHTKNSDEIGWNIHEEGFITIDYGSHITDDGKPCIVLDYLVAPRYDYDKFS